MEFTRNEDSSWNIIGQSSWLALDLPGGAITNRLQLDQWTPNRANNQRWRVDKQAEGTFKTGSQATSGALDNSSSSVNGFKLAQWG
jgi:hypothetical protein